VLEAAQPISVQSARWGVIRLGFSAVPLQRRIHQISARAGAVGAVALAITLVVTTVMLRLVTRPIQQLTAAARRISAGDRAAEVVLRRRDELGELAAAFNKMVADLRAATAAEQSRASQLAEALEQVNQAHEELRRTQAQLAQSGRLASIGQLASGVAHEINNPLSVVLTYAVLVDEKIAGMPPEQQQQLEGIHAQLGRIKLGAERCKAIADNLLAFSRQSGGEKMEVAVHEVVTRTFDLLGASLSRARIRVVRDVPEELMVWGHASQLQQVLTNLALNAVQAMGSEGELTVRAFAPGDGTTAIEVQDTGPGIATEHLDRIFDPFFTTKPVGQGTGLGLSIVYGIVTAHGGTIVVDSRPGRGALFRITLPGRRPERPDKEPA